jgi:hypothetical protein
MRGMLDPLDSNLLRPLFRACYERLSQAGVIREYQDRQQRVIVSVGGVEHFSSTTVHCDQCTTRTLRNGQTSYHHAGLAAVIAHPQHKEVFPLDFESILNQDGAQKNDCERNAAKRLCAALNERYPDLKLILVEDALYANAPFPGISSLWRKLGKNAPSQGLDNGATRETALKRVSECIIHRWQIETASRFRKQRLCTDLPKLRQV